jgi:hypothetical protein
VTFAGAEVRERHLVSAADFGVEVMNLGRESVWRKPLCHGVSVKKRSIYSLWGGTEDAVMADGVCG